MTTWTTAPLDKVVIQYCDFCEKEASYTFWFGHQYQTCVEHQF